MGFHLFALGILVAIAIADLIVGVANDAVNFLNSSVGFQVKGKKTPEPEPPGQVD